MHKADFRVVELDKGVKVVHCSDNVRVLKLLQHVVLVQESLAAGSVSFIFISVKGHLENVAERLAIWCCLLIDGGVLGLVHQKVIDLRIVIDQLHGVGSLL